MAKQGHTGEDLKKWGLVWDDKQKMYVKPKTTLQPRQKTLIEYIEPLQNSIFNVQNKIQHEIAKQKNIYSIEFPVDPMGKPRMTQSDKWRKREVTNRYWELKRQVKQIAEGYKFIMPESNYHMIFYIPMPDSWSKKKKVEFDGKPHQQKPDKDNLEKAILDALCPEDSYVWDGRVSKYWSRNGKIVIKNI